MTWFTYRLSDGRTGGAETLMRCTVGCLFELDKLELRSAKIFDGQQSDGAKVVGRINLDGEA